MMVLSLPHLTFGVRTLLDQVMRLISDGLGVFGTLLTSHPEEKVDCLRIE